MATRLPSGQQAPPIGAHRNLTATFLRLRDASRAHSRPFSAARDEKAKAHDSSRLLAAALDSRGTGQEIDHIATGGDISVNMPPAWVSVSDEVTTTMGRIKERLAELSALHARALLPNFDEFSGEDAKVEVLTQEITRLFKRCEKNLTALSVAKGPDAGDAKVRQNVVRMMAAELQKQSVDFRRKQKDYLQKLKQLQDRGPGGDVFGEITGGGATGGGDDYDPGFTDMQVQRSNTMIDEAIARDQEVVKIIESVNELAAIMKDLSVLVIDQGTILDRIDYNVEQVAGSVAEGVKQLEAAEKTQKRNWLMTIISLLMVLVILMIVVVSIKALAKAG